MNQMHVLLITIEKLQTWKANIDMQPIFKHYKSVTYLCACFPKSKDSTSGHKASIKWK